MEDRESLSSDAVGRNGELGMTAEEKVQQWSITLVGQTGDQALAPCSPSYSHTSHGGDDPGADDEDDVGFGASAEIVLSELDMARINFVTCTAPFTWLLQPGNLRRI